MQPWSWSTSEAVSSGEAALFEEVLLSALVACLYYACCLLSSYGGLG